MSFRETGLPEEVRNLIMSELSYPDIIRVYRTSTLYRYIMQDDKLWEALLDRDFPKSNIIFPSILLLGKTTTRNIKIYTEK